MKCLVTGGAGFIGSNLVERLVKEHHEVTVLDDLSTGNKKNLEGVQQNITFVKASITDKESLAKAAKGVEVIFHLAAMISVPDSIADPVKANWINVHGTVNVLIAAKQNKAKVVFASSCAVYGDTPVIPVSEKELPCPLSPYGLNKLTAEQYLQLFNHLYGLPYAALRFFNVFGPKQDPQSPYAAVIPLFIQKLLKDEHPSIFGDGEQTRDFVFVQNIVDALLLAATTNKNGVFNIGSGEQVSINQLVKELNDLLKKKLEPEYLAERPGDIKHSRADITLAKQELGFTPRVRFSEGLQETLSWFWKQG